MKLQSELQSVGKPTKVVGVDTSTKGFAYALIDDGELVEYDLIPFTGSSLSDKMAEARAAGDYIASLDPDFALVEQVIHLNNRAVVIKLAYFAGIALSSLAAAGVRFDDVVPIQWQNAIGNPKFTKAEKAKLKKESPGRSTSWINNRRRELRKQRTIDIVNAKFGTEIEDDNIADAVGIALYALEV